MAASGNDEQDQLPAGEESPAPPMKPSEGPAAPPKRRRSILGTLFTYLMLLAIVAIGLGFAAIALKDKDERIALVAGYAEQALAEAEANVEKAKVKVSELLGEAPPPQNSKVTTHRTVPLAQAPEPEPAPQNPAPEPQSSAPPAPVMQPEPPPKPAPAAEPAPSPEPPAAPPVTAMPSQPAPITAPPVASADLSAFEERLAAAQESARKALALAEAGQAAAEAASKLAEAGRRDAAGEAGGVTAKEMAAALDGRIDELGNELKALREKLDSPKNETRAAPDSDTQKAGDGAATMVVVAYALQRELDAGRPFVDEVAALTRLGAAPAVIERLSPFSEKGAPTPAQLRDAFHAIAKKLRAAEGHGGGDLSERLLQGASKIVRVRPVGQSEPQTAEGKIEKIEAALAHGDLIAAETALVALPDAAKSEANAFGETLRQRIDAAAAADEVLHGAIAALGSAKK